MTHSDLLAGWPAGPALTGAAQDDELLVSKQVVVQHAQVLEDCHGLIVVHAAGAAQLPCGLAGHAAAQPVPGVVDAAAVLGVAALVGVQAAVLDAVVVRPHQHHRPLACLGDGREQGVGVARRPLRIRDGLQGRLQPLPPGLVLAQARDQGAPAGDGVHDVVRRHGLLQRHALEML